MALGMSTSGVPVTRRAIFLASGTFTPTVSDIEVWLVGGGGSGGPGNNQGGRYGGDGGDVKHRYLQVTPGVGIAVAIGAGGVSPASAQNSAVTGTDGSATTFGSLSASGGAGALNARKSNGGLGQYPTTGTAAAAAGVVVPGLEGVRLAGGGGVGQLSGGSNSAGTNGGAGGGGAGGGGFQGGAAEARQVADTGVAPSTIFPQSSATAQGGAGAPNTGSGGGGGAYNNTNSYYGAGGDGGSGLVIVQWTELA